MIPPGYKIDDSPSPSRLRRTEADRIMIGKKLGTKHLPRNAKHWKAIEAWLLGGFDPGLPDTEGDEPTPRQVREEGLPPRAWLIPIEPEVKKQAEAQPEEAPPMKARLPTVAEARARFGLPPKPSG